MNQKQSELTKRIEASALEPVELTPYERLQMDFRNWSNRAGEALQRMHIIQRTIKQFDEGERNTLPFELVAQKAAEISALVGQLELLDGIRKGAQARADALQIQIQSSGAANVSLRVVAYRLLRADLYQTGLRLQELSSILPQNRQPDWDEAYAKVNGSFVQLHRELEQYADIEQSEELARKVRLGS